jgi:uncharacterized membrane protein (UPF0127 family)
MGRSALLLVACAALAGCGEEPEPAFTSPVAFDTATVWIRTGSDSTSLLVEVARTSAQRTYGLMARPALDPNSGMLFLYDSVQTPTSGFWMFRTRMPLDIAFMDSTGMIVRTLAMEPCASDLYASSCPTYAPQVHWRDALEVNRGWFAERGIGEGSVVRLEGAGAAGAPDTASGL